MVTKKRALPPGEAVPEEQRIEDLGGQLSALLGELVATHLLTELDRRILSLRMGLEDGSCYTLNETAAILQRSPELVRTRQYLALKKHSRDLRFFKLLRDYARTVKLPRGVTYYLYRYSDFEDHF